MANVSFAKAGKPASAPEDTTTVPTVPTTEVPRQLPAAPAPRSLSRFSGGDDEDEPQDNSDVLPPRLNIVQGLSGAELKSVGPDGTLVLKKSLAIPQPAQIVVAGFSAKTYAEKLPKFGEGKPRIFSNLEDVYNAGGTDVWKQSRENKDSDGMPVSKRPWFTPMVTALLLIKKWDGISAEDEQHFKAVTSDGIAFAPAVFTVKSTGFSGFYVPLKSEQSMGVLSKGYYTRYVSLSTKQVRAFEPVVTIKGETSETVRQLARTLLT